MAKNSLRQYDPVAANNTDIGSISLQENITKPSDVNNFERTAMSHIAQYLTEMSYPTAGGTSDALTLTPTTALAALANNVVYTFTGASANTTTSPTLNVSSLGAKQLRKIVGGSDVALAVGDIQAGAQYHAMYSTTANSSAGGWLVFEAGFGGKSQIAAWDGISAQGSDIASAATLNLTTATGPIVNVTGTTTVTAITLAQGDWRIIKLTGAVPFTLGSSLIFNGVASATNAPSGYTGAAGDLLMASGESGGVVRLYTMSPNFGIFTPTISFVTPGDLSVAYSAQVGYYWKYGNVINANFTITTSTFTYTTASGNAQIGGFPFANMNGTSGASYGPMRFQGITKASYTTFIARLANNAAVATISASGSGQTTTTLTTADMPTAGTVNLQGTVTYITGT